MWWAQQRNSGTDHHFRSERTAPSVLVWKTDNLISLHISIAHFKMVPQHWRSEWVKSVSHTVNGSFKRNTCNSNILLSNPDNIFACFTNICWGVPSALVVQGGEPCVGLGHLPLWEPPQLIYPSQFFTATHACGNSLFCLSASPVSLVVNFMCLWEKNNTVLT